MVLSEGITEKKSPLTPPGIDPGTVRLVAQRLNHYATPEVYKYTFVICNTYCVSTAKMVTRTRLKFMAVSPQFVLSCIGNVHPVKGREGPEGQ